MVSAAGVVVAVVFFVLLYFSIPPPPLGRVPPPRDVGIFSSPDSSPLKLRSIPKPNPNLLILTKATPVPSNCQVHRFNLLYWSIPTIPLQVYYWLNRSPHVCVYLLLVLFDLYFPCRKAPSLEEKDGGSWLLRPVRESNLQLFSLASIWISNKVRYNSFSRFLKKTKASLSVVGKS